jgi:hypothetical protein
MWLVLGYASTGLDTASPEARQIYQRNRIAYPFWSFSIVGMCGLHYCRNSLRAS